MPSDDDIREIEQLQKDKQRAANADASMSSDRLIDHLILLGKIAGAYLVASLAVGISEAVLHPLPHSGLTWPGIVFAPVFPVVYLADLIGGSLSESGGRFLLWFAGAFAICLWLLFPRRRKTSRNVSNH
jgi:hypothetical protein